MLEIVADRAFAEVQSGRSLSIAQSVRNSDRYLSFALGKAIRSAKILSRQGHRLCKGFHNISEIQTASPDLAITNSAKALGEDSYGLIAKHNAMSAKAEGVDDEFSVTRIEQYNDSSPQSEGMDVANQSESIGGAGDEPRANDRHVRFAFFQHRKSLRRIYRGSDHGDAAPTTTKRILNQLTIHSIRFRDQNGKRSVDNARSPHEIPQRP